MNSAEHQWFYRKSGMVADEVAGPIPQYELMELMLKGRLKAATLVSSPTATGNEWRALGEISWLNERVSRIREERKRAKDEERTQKRKAKVEKQDSRSRWSSTDNSGVDLLQPITTGRSSEFVEVPVLTPSRSTPQSRSSVTNPDPLRNPVATLERFLFAGLRFGMLGLIALSLAGVAFCGIRFLTIGLLSFSIPSYDQVASEYEAESHADSSGPAGRLGEPDSASATMPELTRLIEEIRDSDGELTASVFNSQVEAMHLAMEPSQRRHAKRGLERLLKRSRDENKPLATKLAYVRTYFDLIAEEELEEAANPMARYALVGVGGYLIGLVGLLSLVLVLLAIERNTRLQTA